LRQSDTTHFLENRALNQRYAGQSHDEAVAARKNRKQRAQEQADGVMAVDGTEADSAHGRGKLSEHGKQVWRTGSGLDGGRKAPTR